MGNTEKNIKRHLPPELRKLVAIQSKLSLDLDKVDGDVTDALFNLLNAFIDTYNKAHEKKLGRISTSTIDRALFLTNETMGFSHDTADLFCLYATKGKLDWNKFVKAYKVSKNYKFKEKANNPLEADDDDSEAKENPSIEITTLVDYLRRQLQCFEYVSFELARDLTKIRIQDILLPSLTPSKRYSMPSQSDNTRRSSNFRPQSILNKSPNTIIIADGGMGKTTIAKYIFYEYANRVLYSKGIVIPLFIELKQNSNIKDAVAQQLSDTWLNNVYTVLKGYTLLFILDGFDEFDTDRRSLIEEISELRLRHPSSKFLISSRPDIDVQDLVSDGFTAYDIAPIYDRDSVKNELPYYLATLLIKDEIEFNEFIEYQDALDLPYTIRINYLFYTLFILHFLIEKKKRLATTKGGILKAVLENYITIWELSDIRVRQALPQNITGSLIFDILGTIALISCYPSVFEQDKSRKVYYQGLCLYSGKGFTQDNIRNILAMHDKALAMHTAAFIKFFFDSGILSSSYFNLYFLSNQIIADYFSARAFTEVCFNKKLNLPYAKNRRLQSKLLFEFFENNVVHSSDSPLEFSVVASALSNPNEIITERFIERNDINLSEDAYRSYLLMIACIVFERKENLSAESRAFAIRRFIYYSTHIPVPPRAYLHRLANFLYRDSIIPWLKPLTAANDQLAFDFIFKEFSSNNQKRPRYLFWNYFMNVSPNELLMHSCIKSLDSGSSDFELKYLAKFYPNLSVDYYINYFLNKFPKAGVRLSAEPFSYLWENAEKHRRLHGDHEDKTLKLAELILFRLTQSDDHFTTWELVKIIQKCRYFHSRKLFTYPLITLLTSTNSNFERLDILSKLNLIEMLTLQDMNVYSESFVQLLDTSDNEICTRVFALYMNAYDNSLQSQRHIPPPIQERILKKVNGGSTHCWYYCRRMQIPMDPNVDEAHRQVFWAE
jgi:hypothetical protein